MATVTNSYCISEGSNKETNHYEISLKGSGIRYKPGDSLGFYPMNNHELVKKTIRKIKAKKSDPINTKETGDTTLENALLNRFVIHRAGKKFLTAVAEKTEKKKTKKELEEILEDQEKTEKYLFTRDCIDILNEYPVRFTPQEFVDTLSPIAPRLYSISSSPKAHPGEVHLTVAIVKYNNFDRDRFGLATGDLANRIEVNKTKIPIYISKTRDFIIPEDGSKDIIMVGPGTGIAPFRAFIEHRKETGASGRNWLFFGEVHEESTTEQCVQSLQIVEYLPLEGTHNHHQNALLACNSDSAYCNGPLQKFASREEDDCKHPQWPYLLEPELYCECLQAFI